MADFRRRLFCSKWGIFAKSEIKAILCTQEVHGPDRKHVLPIVHQAKKCFVEIFYLLLKNKFCSGQHNK